MRRAVIYGVVPPLFGHPPLKSVTARLNELAELGVDALWLSPLYTTDDPSQISYAVTDYRSVRADFGNEADLKALVKGAHDRGMRVILDFVPNHVSAAHPAYADAEARGEASPHHGWFARDAQGNPTHYFDWEPLKNLNLDHPEAERMVIDGFLHWVREFDVDGFRVDAAWGPRERSPHFWKKLDVALRKQKPDAFLLAEASAQDPFYVHNGFDAAYDWTDELGVWAWRRAFEDLSKIGPRLTAALGSAPTPNHRVARFINNNDTGERFITKHGPDVTRVAATLMHLVPGIPMLFTGDEVGAEYDPYDDAPPLTFADRHGLRSHYRRLAELRERVPAIRDGAYLPLPVIGNPSAFAFLRDAGEDEQAVVVLNFGEPSTLQLALPESPRLRALLQGKVEDALAADGKAPKLDMKTPGLLIVQLPARSGVVLVPATSDAPAVH